MALSPTIMSETVLNAEDQASLWKGRSYLYGILATILNRPDETDWIQGLFDPLGVIIHELELSGSVQALMLELSQFFKTASSEQVSEWCREARREYDRLFLVPIRDQMVSLGASEYLKDEEILGDRRLKWEDWYMRFGFEWREFFADSVGVWPNEPEHVALVLPMLSIMADEVSLSTLERDEFSNDLQAVYHDMLKLANDWLPNCFQAISQASAHPLYTAFSAVGKDFFELDFQHTMRGNL